MSGSAPPGRDFLDDAGGATELTARAIDVYGDRARVHGYDLDDDLSATRSATEITLCTLTGALPSELEAQSFELALKLAPAFGVHEGPTHSALIARACGADETASLGAGLVVLGQRCGADVAAHAALVAWAREAGVGPAPSCAHDDTCDAAALEQLARLPSAPALDALKAAAPCRVGLALALAALAGVHERGALEAMLIHARLPALAAELVAAPRGELAQIPMNLPRFRYEP